MELNKPRYYFLLIFLFSLVVRVCYLNEPHFEHLKTSLFGDEITHFHWAKALYLKEYDSVYPSFRSPLYGILTSFCFHLTSEPIALMKLLQTLLGGFTVFFSTIALTHIFGLTVGILSGIILSLNPYLIYYEHQLLIDSIPLFFLAALLCFMAKKKTYQSIDSILMGIILAICALLRSNYVILIIPLFLHIFYKNKKNSVLFLVGYILALSPFLITNSFYNGKYCGLATQGGINFWAGNHKNADGLIPFSPSIPSTEYHHNLNSLPDKVWKIDNMWTTSNIIARSHSPDMSLPESDASQFFYHLALKEIVEDPSVFLARILKKCLFLFSTDTIPNNTYPDYFFTHYSPLLNHLNSPLLFKALAFFFLPGFIYSWGHLKDSRWFHALLICLGIVLILFFVNTRFKTSLILFSIPLSIHGMLIIIKSIRALNIKKTLHVIILGLLSISLAHAHKLYPEGYAIKASLALYHHRLAQIFLEHHELNSARQELNSALEMNTSEKSIFYYTLAMTYKEESKETTKFYLEQSLTLDYNPLVYQTLLELYKTDNEISKIDTLTRTFAPSKSMALGKQRIIRQTRH